MVLEYLPTFTYTFTLQKWPSFVGKYSSTMEHLGNGWSWRRNATAACSGRLVEGISGKSDHDMGYGVKTYTLW